MYAMYTALSSTGLRPSNDIPSASSANAVGGKVKHSAHKANDVAVRSFENSFVNLLALNILSLPVVEYIFRSNEFPGSNQY
jgi:hypothetical protein